MPDHLAMLAIWFVFAIASSATGAALLDDEDDAPTELRRGLLTTYKDATGVEFLRDEPLPRVLLERDESPDARLKPGAWTAQWQGLLDIQRPGRYRFSATSTGAAELKIDGQPVTLPPPAAAAANEGVVNLTFGPHLVSVRFTPKAGAPARLELYWECESIERESIPFRAFAHPATEPPAADLFFHGRLQVEEHNCVACHRSSDKLPISAQLARRAGPKLTGAGSRLKAGWIYHWLADPSALRHEATMPRLFSDDTAGQAERYAVAQYLASQGTPLEIIPDPPQPVIVQTVADGEQLFARVGCVVCHARQGERPAQVTLKGLSQKTTPEVLETFIRNPASVAPAGRMPAFVLGKLEVRQLAMYLSQYDAAATQPLSLPDAPPTAAAIAALDALKLTDADREKFLTLAPAEQWKSLGRQVMQSKGCASCHDIKEAGEKSLWKAEPSKLDLAAVAEHSDRGCLAVVATSGATSDASTAPKYGANLKREAVATFLKAALVAPASKAPGEQARLTIERFNCQGCHERSGVGGLSPELLNRLGSGDTAAAETQTPPSLTQVTGKLTREALVAVLEQHERSRPWMYLQMPRFAKEHVHDLPPQLAALDGQPLVDAPTPAPKGEDGPAADPLADAGRTLVGTKGFGCIKCHDMLGTPASGTRGPDLAKVPGRILQTWYHRWMTDPQRIQPGTRMPTVFLEGKSPFKEILGGDPARQRDAIWSYMAVASSLPAPEGLEEVKLQTLVADSKPLVVRTFLPGTTPRGIATRFPNQVHAAFDAQMGRMAFAWSGEFLDMGPVWNGRGGHPAHVLGKTFWTAPPGCPWEVTPAAASAPSFAGRGEEGSLGALLKDSKLHPSRLTFNGYSLSAFGPTFRYRLAQEDGSAGITIAEHLDSLRADAGVGVLRELKLGIPKGKVAWLNIVESEVEPSIAKGSATAALGNEKQAADPTSLIRVEQAGQPLLLRVRRATAAADWLAVRLGERYGVVLRIEPSGDEAETELDLSLWKPTDNEAETWRKLVAEELK
jgi:mono/diheme cytochrome c family protein